MEGNRIRKIRKERKLSINELSTRTGISKSYLSLLERGIHNNPSLEVLNKIANVLQVNIDILIGEEEAAEEKHVVSIEIKLLEKDINSQSLNQLKDMLDHFGKD
ncbi:helix-turn-helix domain-containing protein [Thalassobacillus devorans]|uniref:helix-turn-helix domain-containing protein n=1 Tax=Thalassobacillus devorans TaxID=279813 RepID=UPI0004917B1C|nr:helix-turn-helix transcriptional regulator [Thalassobacillus devorans]